jgi:hypothetical protein
MNAQTEQRSNRNTIPTRFLLVFSGCLVAALLLVLSSDSSAPLQVAQAAQVEVALREAPVAAAAPALLAQAEGKSGTLKGTISYEGTVPERRVVHKMGDNVKDAPVCSAADLLADDFVVDKDSKGIAHIFVFLRKAPAGSRVPPPPAEPLVFDQQACRFIPHTLTVQTGRTLLLKNGDAILHNTHISPIKNNGFNQAIGANDRTGVSFKYSKPENLPTEVKCDVHTWMKAYHLVLDHPWMAVTDEQGQFQIDALPAGKHEFFVWHEKVGYLNRKLNVEIKPGETKDIKLSYGEKNFMAFDGPRPKSVAIRTEP